jgi:hypothetical protein
MQHRPVEPFHDQKAQPVMFYVVMNPHDVRMIEFAERGGFTDETRPQRRVGVSVGQHFDRGLPADAAVTCGEHDAVTTTPDPLTDLECG